MGGGIAAAVLVRDGRAKLAPGRVCVLHILLEEVRAQTAAGPHAAAGARAVPPDVPARRSQRVPQFLVVGPPQTTDRHQRPDAQHLAVQRHARHQQLVSVIELRQLRVHAAVGRQEALDDATLNPPPNRARTPVPFPPQADVAVGGGVDRAPNRPSRAGRPREGGPRFGMDCRAFTTENSYRELQIYPRKSMVVRVDCLEFIKFMLPILV